jgi:hypothetical protein
MCFDALWMAIGDQGQPEAMFEERLPARDPKKNPGE